MTPAEALAAWGEGEPLLASTLLRFACAILAGLWLASLVAWMVWGMGYPALLVSVVNVSLNLAYRRRVEAAVSAVESAARDLGLLSGVLARLEGEQFSAPRGSSNCGHAPFAGLASFALDCSLESIGGVSRFKAQHVCRLDRPLRVLDVAVRLRG